MISFFRRVQWWLQRNHKENDLREELEFHLAEEARERQADGLTEHEARWAARRDLAIFASSVVVSWLWLETGGLAQARIDLTEQLAAGKLPRCQSGSHAAEG
jgi:hypothetical protein